MSKWTCYRGFTLLELMIAVAIIGILAAVAYPMYQGSNERGFRAQALIVMRGMVGGMEDVSSNNDTDGNNATMNYQGGTAQDALNAANLNQHSIHKFYDFSVAVVNDCLPINTAPDGTDDWGCYSITATPKERMAGTGELWLHSDGRYGWDHDNDASTDYVALD